ncbi:uncharacterized protein VTP21DRAFT_3597 [Calcarisporiella thermophila]|uniref:uncharacterized protein n=1 Tax=Calcarisporiella thermophila TaxID=911321 RepID=UPI0037438BE9
MAPRRPGGRSHQCPPNGCAMSADTDEADAVLTTSTSAQGILIIGRGLVTQYT